MIGCLRTRVRKQPIIALYFEFETVLKFYNLGAWFCDLVICFFSSFANVLPDEERADCSNYIIA